LLKSRRGYTFISNAKFLQGGLTVATAESCTAGLVAYGLTSIAGSSDYFKQGWVVYQTESKRTEFALPHKVEVYSEGCAEHLAQSCMLRSGADFGIGVTGKADDGLGCVWFAVASRRGMGRRVRTYTGTRNLIRKQAALDIIKYFDFWLKETI
jgi:PncC family amidohydrolase